MKQCEDCDYRKRTPTHDSYCMKHNHRPSGSCKDFRYLPTPLYDEAVRFMDEDELGGLYD